MSTYRIDVKSGLISHHVTMRSESVHQGYWVFLWPNTAINIYGNGASIERIVPISEELKPSHLPVPLFGGDLSGRNRRHHC